MYTRIRNVQILISLLKQYGIKKLVLSPGSRNIPFVHSVEEDSYFQCYSVVDERSAGYFAIGLAVQSGEPVAVSCTSSTATCNYTPAVSEAYYQGVPIVFITSDKMPQNLNQMDPQHINQVDMYRNFVKKAVDVPLADSALNEWYCNRIINEGLIAATTGRRGPVQINMHIKDHSIDIGNYVKEIPQERKIEYYTRCDSKISKMLQSKKRILIVAGQIHDDINKELRGFTEKYNCCVLTEPTSNIHGEYCINGYSLVEMMGTSELKKLCPDLIITIGGNWVSYIHSRLDKLHNQFEHWSICEDGEIVDCFHSLTAVFEMSTKEFLCDMADKSSSVNDGVFYDEWKTKKELVYVDDLPYSNFWITGEYVKSLPKDCIYHTGILNSTRDSFFYEFDNTIYYHSNIGTDGIDGVMSTFLGSSMATEKQCFLLLGDLSFFYDMNSLGIRGLKNNVHILLINNKAGAEFHLNIGLKKDPELNLHTSAEHNHSAKGWVESLGYEYLTADDKESFRQNLSRFMSASHETPVVFEVFTDANIDGEIGRQVMEQYRNKLNTSFEGHAKQMIINVLGENTVRKVRESLNKKM